MRSCSRTSSPRPTIGSSRSSSSGRSRKTRSISSSTVAVSRPSASTLGVSGANAGSFASDASTRVHLARHLAEPPQPLEERVRRARRSRRARAPSRRSPPRTNSWRIPSVAPSGPPEYAYQPPSARDVREAVLGEEAQHLELRVDPRLEPAEDLEDQLVVEDDRRVRLLGADRARVEQLAAEAGEALDRRGTRRCPRRPAASGRSASRCTSSRASCGSSRPSISSSSSRSA